MYYLLTFCEDWADEHNVPALDCKTEEQYQAWLKRPSGKLNPKYEEQMARYQANEDLNTNFWKTLKEAGIENTMKIPKNNLQLVNLEKRYRSEHKYMRMPPKVLSCLSANLGNSGDGFGEGYSNHYLMEEFVADGSVAVTPVDEEFYNVFHKAKLDNLSLCNIFDDDILAYMDEDAEEFEMEDD